MTDLQPGDIGFAHGSGWVDWAIRVAEQRRYGKGSPFSWANHVFMIVDRAGALIEAQGRGVVLSDMGAYPDPTTYSIWRPVWPTPDSASVAVAGMYGLLGKKYGYLTIACEGLAFLTGTRLRFGISGQYICSGAAAHELVRTGIDLGDDSDWNSPADDLQAAKKLGWTHVAGVVLAL